MRVASLADRDGSFQRVGEVSCLGPGALQLCLSLRKQDVDLFEQPAATHSGHRRYTCVRDGPQLRAAGLALAAPKITMLCYPRILGYVFNPLTVWFCHEGTELRAILYEVHNTFGGRHTYVTRAEEGATGAYGTTGKAFRVSPFNTVEGHYGLRATLPGETLALGVSLTAPEGPLLKAYFTARRRPLTTAGLLAIFARLPFQSLKVVGVIHWEALKLWRKGLKLHPPS